MNRYWFLLVILFLVATLLICYISLYIEASKEVGEIGDRGERGDKGPDGLEGPPGEAGGIIPSVAARVGNVPEPSLCDNFTGVQVNLVPVEFTLPGPCIPSRDVMVITWCPNLRQAIPVQEFYYRTCHAWRRKDPSGRWTEWL